MKTIISILKEQQAVLFDSIAESDVIDFDCPVDYILFNSSLQDHIKAITSEYCEAHAKNDNFDNKKCVACWNLLVDEAKYIKQDSSTTNEVEVCPVCDDSRDVTIDEDGKRFCHMCGQGYTNPKKEILSEGTMLSEDTVKEMLRFAEDLATIGKNPVKILRKELKNGTYQ